MASLTLVYVMSITPSASKHWLSMQRKPAEYPVFSPDPSASHISLHANLNSMIPQYWIHHFFLEVKWAQEWRMTHARARRSQQDAWSCCRAQHNATGLFQLSSKAQSHTIWSLLVFYWLSNKWTWLFFYLTIWQSRTQKFQCTDLCKWCDYHVFSMSATQNRKHRRKKHKTKVWEASYTNINSKN